MNEWINHILSFCPFFAGNIWTDHIGLDIYDTGNRLKYTAQKVNILPMR